MFSNLDAAVAAYRRAIGWRPLYYRLTDLAVACEAKMQADPVHAAKWRKEALAAWRKTYALAPENPGFSPDYVVNIGKRIAWLERQ